MKSLHGKCVIGDCGMGMSGMTWERGRKGQVRNCMPVTTHAFVTLAATKADSFNLLSDNIWIMAGLDLEAAVVGP